MNITLRNPERRDWMTGWGVINRALAEICGSIDDRSADVHLFMSPPYSFQDVDPAKFNVGLTMCERPDLSTYKWANGGFVALTNQMDLVLVPSAWQLHIFKQNGVVKPIEIVPLGHADGTWRAAIRNPGRVNVSALILDRGRDHGGGSNVLGRYFSDINYINARTPKSDGTKANTEIIKKGRLKPEAIFQAYREADVFLKWGREGYCYPILEAMSAGCLVVTNCVHLPYIEEGKNCLTFRNVGELKKKLDWASRNSGDNIKVAGQATAKLLTWEKSKKAILGVINKHTSEGKP